MTTLLIDLGNTALKWTPIEEPDNPHTIIHKGSTHFKEELYDLWLNMRPKRIIGCTVAAPVVAFSLTKFFNDHGIRTDKHIIFNNYRRCTGRLNNTGKNGTGTDMAILSNCRSSS